MSTFAVQFRYDMTFSELGLREEVYSAVKEIGFEKPTEIQEQAIPVLVDFAQ